MPDLIECEVCGAKCHGLPGDATGALMTTEDGRIAPLEKASKILPRCLMHLSESRTDTDKSATGDSGGAAKKKGRK